MQPKLCRIVNNTVVVIMIIGSKVNKQLLVDYTKKWYCYNFVWNKAQAGCGKQCPFLPDLQNKQAVANDRA